MTDHVFKTRAGTVLSEVQYGLLQTWRRRCATASGKNPSFPFAAPVRLARSRAEKQEDLSRSTCFLAGLPSRIVQLVLSLQGPPCRERVLCNSPLEIYLLPSKSTFTCGWAATSAFSEMQGIGPCGAEPFCLLPLRSADQPANVVRTLTESTVSIWRKRGDERQISAISSLCKLLNGAHWTLHDGSGSKRLALLGRRCCSM